MINRLQKICKAQAQNSRRNAPKRDQIAYFMAQMGAKNGTHVPKTWAEALKITKA